MLTNNGIRMLSLMLMPRPIEPKYDDDMSKEQNIMYYTPISGVLTKEVAYSGSNYSKGISFFIQGSGTYYNQYPFTITNTSTRAYLIDDMEQNTAPSKQDWKDKGYVQLFCGSGDTPPTREDYKLENQIVFKKESCTASIISLGKVNIATTMINNTDEDKTIKELCLCRFIGATSTENATPLNNLIMYARKVLDEPITVQPNEVFTINYTMDFTNMSD